MNFCMMVKYMSHGMPGSYILCHLMCTSLLELMKHAEIHEIHEINRRLLKQKFVASKHWVTPLETPSES